MMLEGMRRVLPSMGRRVERFLQELSSKQLLDPDSLEDVDLRQALCRNIASLSY